MVAMAESASDRAHVLAVIPSWGGRIRRSAWELVGAARDLADLMGERAEALLLGHKLEAGSAEEAIHRGADRVHRVDVPELEGLDHEVCLEILGTVIPELNPEIVLLPATDWGQPVAARSAERLATALLPSCRRLSLDRSQRLLLGTRLAFGGLEVTCAVEEGRPQMATVLPGAIEPYPPDSRRHGEILDLRLSLRSPRPASQPSDCDVASRALLPEADLVGGEGLGGPAGFELLERAADRLGARMLASRGAIDRKWVSADRRFYRERGELDPEVLICCGVWGNVEELLPAAESPYLVAIHSDPAAPILEIARVGVIAEVEPVVRALIEELEKPPE